MTICYLGLGSNQKFPERQIRRAVLSVKNIPGTTVIKTSRLYWTKAWGLEAQQDFCNAAIKISTRLSPHKLLKFCQQIENNQGRVRKKNWGPRTLDIDILLYGNKKINTHNLCIPHPYMMARDFVMKPLLEIVAP